MLIAIMMSVTMPSANKTTYYETDCMTLFITAIESCGGTFTPRLEFSLKTQTQDAKRDF
jgi:hypothetical protein